MTTEQIITKMNIKQEYRTICNDRKIYLCKCHLCIIAFHMATDIKLATFVFGSNNYKLTKNGTLHELCDILIPTQLECYKMSLISSLIVYLKVGG